MCHPDQLKRSVRPVLTTGKWWVLERAYGRNFYLEHLPGRHTKDGIFDWTNQVSLAAGWYTKDSAVFAAKAIGLTVLPPLPSTRTGD